MEVKAIHKSARISAQKTRLVADQIRGLPIARALNILNFSPKKAAFIVKKVVESAIANAEHNKGSFLRAEIQNVQCACNRQTTYLVCDQACLLRRNAGAFVNSFNFHHHPLTSSLLSCQQRDL